jgi:hypothetical protein
MRKQTSKVNHLRPALAETKSVSEMALSNDESENGPKTVSLKSEVSNQEVDLLREVVEKLSQATADGSVEAFAISVIEAAKLCNGILFGIERHPALQAELRRLGVLPICAFALEEPTRETLKFLASKGFGEEVPGRKGSAAGGGKPRDFFSGNRSTIIAYELMLVMERLRESHAAGVVLTGLCADIGKLRPLQRKKGRDTGTINETAKAWAKMGFRLLCERPLEVGALPEIPDSWRTAQVSRTHQKAEQRLKTVTEQLLAKAFMSHAVHVS